jgi:DNA-binding NarL/FixJ family response regulator
MIEGLVQLLSRSEEFKIVATGKSAQDILDICEALEPEVIVVDLLMDDDICKVITAAIRIAPNTKVVTFTGAQGVEPAILALDAGATGYVMKGSTSAELLQAIESAHAGETYITRLFASEVIAKLQDASLRRKAAKALILNVRERQIMRLLMIGKNDAEIAIALRISEATLERHIISLWRKLKVRNRREAIIAAKNYECPTVMH